MPTLKQQITDLKKVNEKLCKDNLFMRLEIEDLITDSSSERSKKIIEKYRQKRDERNEQYLAGLN